MLAEARSTAASPRSPWTRSTNNLLLAFLLAAAWATQEWLRGWVFSGFGWNGLGVALHGTWPLIQIAEFTGVAGLSFMVAFANVIAVTTVRRLILEASTRVVRPHFDLTLTLAAIVGVLTFGIRATQVSHLQSRSRLLPCNRMCLKIKNSIRSLRARFSINSGA